MVCSPSPRRRMSSRTATELLHQVVGSPGSMCQLPTAAIWSSTVARHAPNPSKVRASQTSLRTASSTSTDHGSRGDAQRKPASSCRSPATRSRKWGLVRSPVRKAARPADRAWLARSSPAPPGTPDRGRGARTPRSRRGAARAPRSVGARPEAGQARTHTTGGYVRRQGSLLEPLQQERAGQLEAPTRGWP